MSSTSARSLRLWWLGLAAWFVLAGSWFVTHTLLSDDGFYSYCIRQVLRGEVPYRDFPFFQPPLLLYAYAPFYALSGSSVATGRWVTLGLLALGVLLTALAARRQAGPGAALVTALLMATNLGFLVNSSGIKTQGWTVVWLGCLLLFLDRWWLATLAACLAVLTRVSLLPAPLALALYLGRRDGPRSLALSALVLGISGLFWGWLSDGRVLYDLYGAHRDIAAMDYRPAAQVKLEYLRLVLINQGLVSILALLALRPLTRRTAFVGGLWLVCSAIHLLAPTSYPNYQDSILPLAALLAGCRWGPWLAASQGRLAALVALAMALNLVQWQQVRGWMQPDPLRIAERLAPDVAALCPPDRKMMTFVSELAVASGRELWPGMECQEFSFRPDPGRWPDPFCRRQRLLNTSMLLEAIVRREPGLIVLPPLNEQIQGAIEQGYRSVGTAEVRPGLRLPLYVPR